MRILGLDTATSATSVALRDDAGRAAVEIERRDDPPPGARPRHGGRLLALAVEVLDAADLGWDDIDRLAVGVGPGTFTGLRIGVSTALGLAHARDIPIVGVSTLRSLAAGGAQEARRLGIGSVVAVIDARRAEVFAAGWTVDELADPAAGPWLAPAPMAPEALARTLSERAGASLAVGDGAVAFRQALEPSGCLIPGARSASHRASAVQHCRLAAGLAPEAPEAIRPEYLRLPDAEISLRATARR